MLELLLRTPAGAHVEQALDRDDAVAPDLVDAEVFSGLIRARKRDELSEDGLERRVELLRDADVERFPSRDLLSIARSCAAALSGYDALYAALATVLQCPVLTTDSRLAAIAVDQLGIPTICIPTSGWHALDDAP